MLIIKKSLLLVLFLVIFTLVVVAPEVFALTSGDANGDGKVDGLDYIIWLNNYNKPTTPQGVADADFDNNQKVDGVDFVIWLVNFGLPQSTPTAGPTPNPQTNIFMRHPYQHGTQAALVYERFDVTYWIDNWDVKLNEKSVRLLVEKTNTKIVQYDELSTPWKTYKLSGATTYPIITCDSPTQVVIDRKYFTKGPIPVTGLLEGGYYKVTLELLNTDGTTSNVMVSACVEVNRAFLTSLVHVNETSGTSGSESNPASFNAMKQQLAQAMTELGDIPVCPNHDNRRWHAIYDPARKCHYDHEHKDDPNRNYYDNPSNVGRNGVNRGVGDVLSVFGPVWGWLPDRHKAELPSSSTISYPWQTWSGLDIGAPPPVGKMENDIKHNGYLWLTRTPDDFGTNSDTCVPLYNTPNCITHFREQIHALAGMPDAITHTLILVGGSCLSE